MSSEEKEQKRISRREFVKGAAVGAAGVAAAGALASCTTATPEVIKETVEVPVEVIKEVELKPWLPEKWDEEADMVIVGTGFAGLAAAVTANELGQSFLLLEKMPVPGGNSIIAGGGINAADPERQIPQGIEDSTDLHFKHTIEGGDNIADPEKVRYLVENALEAVQFTEKYGVEWRDTVSQGFGALYPRTHSAIKYVDKDGNELRSGRATIIALLEHLEKVGEEVLFEHKVSRLIRESPLEGRVLGVEVEVNGDKKYFKANKGVILASGGFAGNPEWVAKLDRRQAGTDTTNHAGATGECIKFAEDIGADTLHMDYIQAIPSFWGLKPGFKAMFYNINSEEMRAAGGASGYIFINVDGNRYVAESQRRDVIRDATVVQPLFEPLEERVVVDTLEELEEMLGIPKGNLVETINRYNAFCDAGEDLDFDKDPYTLVAFRTPPFRAMSHAIARHHTMGGLLVEGTTAQVVDRWGEIIPGLFAAGEVTGGTHGANRLGFNATPDCLVFGQLTANIVAAE